jgi:hypothetical protein
MEKITRDKLFQSIQDNRPYFADRKIKSFNQKSWRELLPFVKEHIWERNTSVNVFRIAGSTSSQLTDMTWLKFLEQNGKMEHNLKLLEDNPRYYIGARKKNPVMSYIQVDGGDYYVNRGGNCRSCIAKFFFFLKGIVSLHGVEVSHYLIDHEARNIYEALTEKGYIVKPVEKKIAHEDTPGWLREIYEIEFEIITSGKKAVVNKEEARKLIEKPKGGSGGLWRRFKGWFS